LHLTERGRARPFGAVPRPVFYETLQALRQDRVDRYSPRGRPNGAGGWLVKAQSGRGGDAEGGMSAAKLPRACGGCLGARRRRRAWKTAISPGELSNERRSRGARIGTHSIHRCVWRTGGTETSQYPQEEKAKATPSVAASERGPSPNRPDSSGRGCRTRLPSMGRSYQGHH
jgi:hypothetical protein